MARLAPRPTEPPPGNERERHADTRPSCADGEIHQLRTPIRERPLHELHPRRQQDAKQECAARAHPTIELVEDCEDHENPEVRHAIESGSHGIESERYGKQKEQRHCGEVEPEQEVRARPPDGGANRFRLSGRGLQGVAHGLPGIRTADAPRGDGGLL